VILSRKLQKTNKDQHILTIPKSIVQILNWQNKDAIEFGFEKGKIAITKAKVKNKTLTRKLQKTNKDQFILTIPKTLTQLLNWQNKDEIEFGFEHGKITITKGKRGKEVKRSA